MDVTVIRVHLLRALALLLTLAGIATTANLRAVLAKSFFLISGPLGVPGARWRSPGFQSSKERTALKDL
jgi:hypothetical protein